MIEDGHKPVDQPQELGHQLPDIAFENLYLSHSGDSLLERRLATLKNFQTIQLNDTSLSTPASVQTSGANFTFQAGTNSYLTQTSGAPGDDLSYIYPASRISQLVRPTFLPPGTVIMVNDFHFRLPENIHTVDPFALLRAPVTGLAAGVIAAQKQISSFHGETLYGTVSAHTDFGERSYNEDGFLKIELARCAVSDSASAPGTALVVIDGMGGHGAGDVACAALASSLAYDLALGFHAPAALLDGTHVLASKSVDLRAKALADPNLDNDFGNSMGACVTTAEITKELIRFSHCGDVRGLLIRGGRTVYETTDHTLPNRMYELGQITADEVPGHKLSNVVTNSIRIDNGFPQQQDSTRSPFLPLKEGDRILLASDGLFGCITSEEACRIVWNSRSCDDAVKRLRAAAERSGQLSDNITITVYEHHI